MRLRVPALATMAGLALTGAMTVSAPAHAATGLPAAQQHAVTADDGAYVVSEQWIDARTLDVTIHSPAVGADEPVRLLLPPDWNSQPHRTWPVLYLLHGCCGDYTSWSGTDVEQLTANTNVLVVMPEAGTDGFYTNWWNGGDGGAPDWETFHLTELRQILDRGFRAGQSMAVAGLSMGGYGTMKYAETGLFRAAASFSGVLDPLSNPTGVLAYLYPNALWGDPVAQRDIWEANDPTYHVDRLRGVKLFVASGNGQPGPFDQPSQKTDATEAEVYAESLNFVGALQQAHIPVTTDFYGPGTHTWPYWQRDLHTAFPMLMQAIGARPATTAASAAGTADAGAAGGS
jgi:diacylglycerol O-acyltransferase/trehalose O-mycolyltransferase